MASISSTNSTSSLGNTSLRGFGGMASGIDRDSIIEQMTLGTTTKINNQKKKLTQLQWKQEAYRGISDSLIDLTDKYASYSSSSNLKDPYAFAKKLISVHGKESSTSFVTATGSSSLINSVSLKGVQQLATSSVRQSSWHNSGALTTDVSNLDQEVYSSKLEGLKLDFGLWGNDKDGFTKSVSFTFASSYKKQVDGKEETVTIDYTPTTEEGYKKLEEDLNALLEESGITFGDGNKASDVFKFKFTEDSNGQHVLQLEQQAGKDMGGYKIKGTSSALGALGFDTKNTSIPKEGIGLDGFNAEIGNTNFETSAINSPTMLEYLTGKKLTFNYDGSRKEIELITAKEAEELKTLTNNQDRLDKIASNLQERLDKAYGKDAVKVSADGGKLSFATPKNDNGTSSTISVLSSDSTLLKNMGLEYGSSNKVNLDGKLNQDALLGDKAPTGELNLVINGVKIGGLTADSSINDILSKINSTTAAGVKATYVDATGQFMLVSSETGKGREISLGSVDADGNIIKESKDGLAWKLFGGEEADGAKFTEGQNAKIRVSYGNGMDVDLERSSNTFNLEGLSVTVSGVFGGSYKMADPNDASVSKDKEGYELDASGKRIWQEDSSAAVTFSAKADVDGAVEKVKAFFEDFNALVTKINGEVVTRPDSGYQPLTDEQKEQMDETSIENWEKKAKQGMLYGDAAMRDLSMDIQSIFTKMMNNGASYEDLKSIGITYSEDYTDGGTLVFDESAFRTAMENDPEKVSNIFTGGGSVSKGLISVVEDTVTPYATRYANRNGGSYGRLVEIAGTEKKPTTLMKNQIYSQIKEMQDIIDKLQSQLKTEQDRYISQFTTMESLLNKMNNQSSYLSQLTG